MLKDSRDPADLDPSFRRQGEALLARCEARGVRMVPYCTLRHPVTQGGLWRRSRSRSDVDAKIASLRAKGLDYLADCIVNAGSQNGPWATNAIPGLSWHQHRLAWDCYWLHDGKAIWSPSAKRNGINGYAVYREEALAMGLHRAQRKDWPHIQQPAAGSPTSVMSMQEIDRRMRAMFG